MKKIIKAGLLAMAFFGLFSSQLKTAYSQSNKDSQAYQIIKTEAIGQPQVKKLLMVVSIEPGNSSFREMYREKIDHLVQVIQSHWQIEIETIDIKDYQPGLITDFDALFLIEEYGETIPFALFMDLLQSEEKEIIWSGFGSEELIVSLLKKYLIPRRGDLSFTSLQYKEVDFLLGSYFSPTLQYYLPENSERVKVLSLAEKETESREPLIIEIDDRFLILPFEVPFFYSTDDFSLIFLDVLHRSLGHHQPNKQALLRLEDINTYTYRRTDKLGGVYQFLKEKNIPFHLALIPHYLNPSEGIDWELGERFFFTKLIKQMVAEGLGVIVQHGYTHQREEGISGEDYEFWDPETDGPLEGDSAEMVEERVLKAQEMMKKNRLPVPDIWETPHYALSELDNQVINSFYPLRYEHLKKIGKLPFLMVKDGTIFFPENLGYVLETGDIARIEKSLERLSVFEDPVASFFWHPWRDKAELEYLVNKIEQEGYQFVSAYDLVKASDSAAGYLSLVDFRNKRKNILRRYRITQAWMVICFSLFSYGGLLYLRNVWRIKRHFKKIKTCRPTFAQLKKLAKKKKRQLPNLAIFIPARNEAAVIGNTLRRIAKLDYPKKKYQVFVIVDEREKDEKPKLLTQTVVKELGSQLNKKYGAEFINCLEVPKWYSGQFASQAKTYSNSSKGRALNYALQSLVETKKLERTEMIGILDADGRLDRNVLKEVAYKRLEIGSKLLQGPVFQVSNFGQVSFIGVIAGLELAIHHMARMAHRLLRKRKSPQFLAGTNYFIDKELIIEAGGWDNQALVEDAELALRVYVEKGVSVDWLSWPETEQTPPSFSVYRKQRDRWVRGHLHLIKYIRKAKISLKDKIRFISEILMTIFRVIIDLGLPISGLLLVFFGLLLDLGLALRTFSLFLLAMSLFTWDFYGQMYRHLCRRGYIKPQTLSHQLRQSLKLILFIPIFIVAQSVPRITGFFKYAFRLEEGVWYKTERTKETVIRE